SSCFCCTQDAHARLSTPRAPPRSWPILSNSSHTASRAGGDNLSRVSMASWTYVRTARASCVSCEPTASTMAAFFYGMSSMRPRNAARVGEVVRIGLDYALWRIGLEHAISEPVLLTIGDGLCPGIKAQPHLL